MKDFGTSTNPTIFLRLKATDEAPREIAWSQFAVRYVPIINSFARRFGARQQDIDDVVQDVMLGFFLKSPTFVYDPSKGRFRSYLKVCAYRALRKRMGKDLKVAGRPLDQVDENEMAIEQLWNDVWEQDKLRRALDAVRASMGETKTYRAFEQYVVFNNSADVVAESLEMHINSVYRAKEQVTKLLQEKVASIGDDD